MGKEKRQGAERAKVPRNSRPRLLDLGPPLNPPDWWVKILLKKRISRITDAWKAGSPWQPLREKALIARRPVYSLRRDAYLIRVLGQRPERSSVM